MTVTQAAPLVRTADRQHQDRRWSILVLLCLALLLITVDATVLHIAVPALTAALEPSAVQLLWIIDIYSLVVAPLLIMFGTLGDRYGRKRLVLWGFVLFGVASAAAACAPTPLTLILARALLGVGGAMIMPATLSLIRQVFTDRRERAIALGVWSAVAAAGAAIGPLVGGVLVGFWWGAVFLINVPILLVLLPAARRLLPESRGRRDRPWDAVSAALSVFGILALAFGLKEAGSGSLLPLWASVLVFAGGLGLLVAFVRRQTRLPAPFLEIGLFRRREFTTGVAGVLLGVFALVGLQLMLAQYLQLVLGDSPVRAALRMLPLVISAVSGGLAAAHILPRVGMRATMSGGLALVALALTPTLTWGVEGHPVMLAVCFVGIGFGVQVALLAASDTIMASAPEAQAGGAAAIEETAYELGAGLGVAVLGTITTIVYAPGLPAVPGVSEGGMDQARQSLASAAHVADQIGGNAGGALLDAARWAFVNALHTTVVVSVVLLSLTAVAVAMLLSRD
ncbi:MFS transporter [Nonomuraea fuscirosea]|jgi:MFS transporter, DHA2 family, multidrug resistance protein|uniref:DHA2 family multidrug resistance protein-like MFS transporter n=1 Tax=Nonomuraea fuscirosea TaxID=1291556 RepID=A0A2T0MDJ3_9ACTN|nr:MFS transporter [Nonomuraea fuscirosea]PRX55554.1 DHA2 family multidrug resistance protein-like MFS transporter [Nonomuraea fuscirosea]WSA54270.1 MFS transporter [Nonomuraea fuscirosea]